MTVTKVTKDSASIQAATNDVTNAETGTEAQIEAIKVAKMEYTNWGTGLKKTTKKVDQTFKIGTILGLNVLLARKAEKGEKFHMPTRAEMRADDYAAFGYAHRPPKGMTAIQRANWKSTEKSNTFENIITVVDKLVIMVMDSAVRLYVIGGPDKLDLTPIAEVDVIAALSDGCKLVSRDMDLRPSVTVEGTTVKNTNETPCGISMADVNNAWGFHDYGTSQGADTQPGDGTENAVESAVKVVEEAIAQNNIDFESLQTLFGNIAASTMAELFAADIPLFSAVIDLTCDKLTKAQAKLPETITAMATAASAIGKVQKVA